MSATCPCCGGPVDTVKLELNHDERIVRRGGSFARIGPHPFAVLEALVEAYPRVARRESIHSRLYEMRADGEEPDVRIVNVYVCHLRRDLKPLGLTVLSVWGQGYRLVETAADGEGIEVEKSRSQLVHADSDLRPAERMRMAELVSRGASVTTVARELGKPYRKIIAEMEQAGLLRVSA